MRFSLLEVFFRGFREVLNPGSRTFSLPSPTVGVGRPGRHRRGIGAIVFYVATRVVEHYALGVLAGYYPQPRPGGEPSMSWLPVVAHPFYPWLLLLIPTVGGL